MRSFGRFLALVCLAALLLVGGEPALAQTQVGVINGTVIDPSGDGLPGVTVTVSGPSVMGTRTAVTNVNGGFRFPSLLPGDDYIVAFDLTGFNRIVREGIRVPVGQTITLQITMELAAVQDEITVIGETPMVDVTSPTASTSYGQDLLQNVPNSRDWSQAILQTPTTVADTNFVGDVLGSSAFSSRGGAANNNEIAYDGVASTDPVFHYTGQGMIYETVQEVQIVNGALPAELGNAAGAFVNVVTKSGGNQFRGEFSVYYQDDGLQSDNLNDDLREQGVETPPTISDYTDISFNLGGPIVRDKLWFNVALWRYDTATAVSGFPLDDSVERELGFGKITWQPSSQHNLFVMYNRNEILQPYVPADQFHAVESTSRHNDTAEIAKLHWTAILSDNAFVDVDVATAISSGSTAPQEGAGHVYQDAVTGYNWGGNFVYQNNDTDRTQAKASLSWFKDGWAGDHAFKGGIEYEESYYGWDNFNPLTPVYIHQMFNGFPFLAMFSNMPLLTETEYNALNVYLQDTWTVSPRVTLSLGVRLNTTEGIYPAQGNDGYSYGPNVHFDPVRIDDTTAIDWTSFEPRLGATWDLGGDGKSVLRFGLSRYHHQLNMGYFLLSNPNSLSLSLHGWLDSNRDLFADPEEVWPSIGGIAGAYSTVDPNLAQPYTNEITFGFEKELFTDFSLTLNLTWRRDEDLMETINTVISPDSFVPIDVPDPGPDSELGTSDDRILTVYNQIADPIAEFELTNPEPAEREYRGVELVATKRFTRKWQTLASIVWQQAEGSVGNDTVGGSALGGLGAGFNNPNFLINVNGPLTLDREWQLKLVGSYLAPLGFSFSGYYQYLAGTPLFRGYSVTLNQGAVGVVADPKDTYSNDDFSRLDLRAEKTFSFGKRPLELDLMLDVFNVFNENAVISRQNGTGTYNASTGAYVPVPGGFARPLAVQPPRTMRLGARLRF